MFWQNFYNFMFPTCEMPPIFGTFHIVSLILVIAATVLAVWKLKDVSEKTFRKFVFIVWMVLLVGEIYREICFSLSLNDGRFVWDYAWYQFPFQLCSSPLYALPFVAFLKEGKVRDGFLSFLSLWSFFGGTAVVIYAGDVLCTFTLINIQSFIHHGAQVLVGVLIAVRCIKKMDKKYFLRGFTVYFGYICIAMVLNIVGYHLLRANGMDDTFNMMFISPYFNCTLPILSDIHAATSWWVLFPLYLVGFVVVALIIFFAQKLIITRCSNKGQRPSEEEQKEEVNEDCCKNT